MTLARALSILIAVTYLFAAVLLRGSVPQVWIGCVVVILFALACIWFPEALGSYIGSPHVGSVQRSTPGAALAIAGWVVLTMVPLVILVMTG